jgi:DNA primase
VRCDENTYNRFEDPPIEELEARYISRRAADHYGVRWNISKGSWILPIRDQQGKLLGWQEKAGKWVRNWPVGVEKGHTVFGGHLTKPKQRLIVVESPLDCCRLWTAGYDNAVATFGATVTDHQMAILRGGKPLVIAMDNDAAGKASKRMIREKIPRAHAFNYFGYDGKDPGDLADWQIDRGMSHPHTPMTRLRKRLHGL